jgi:hypothetical protein
MGGIMEVPARKWLSASALTGVCLFYGAALAQAPPKTGASCERLLTLGKLLLQQSATMALIARDHRRPSCSMATEALSTAQQALRMVDEDNVRCDIPAKIANSIRLDVRENTRVKELVCRTPGNGI